jgi:hypothetical protein
MAFIINGAHIGDDVVEDEFVAECAIAATGSAKLAVTPTRAMMLRRFRFMMCSFEEVGADHLIDRPDDARQT